MAIKSSTARRRVQRAKPTKAAPTPAPTATAPTPPVTAAPASAARASAAPSGADAGAGETAALDFSTQLELAAAALEEAMEKRDLEIFYRNFRASDLLLLPVRTVDPRRLFDACYEVLLRLGGISPAVGLAVYNHYSVTCSLATFPLHDQPATAARRQAVLDSIAAGRLLVANTTSRVHADKVDSFGTRARRAEGGFIVNGGGAYMSLAQEGDLLFLFAEVENEGYALFLAPLHDNPGIEIGPFLFPSAMLDSDTRRVTFHDLFIRQDDMLMVDPGIAAFQLTWLQALFAAPFLGAAERAFEEARKFLRTVRGADGKPLAELDGMMVDLGRLAIRYRGVRALGREAGEAVAAICGRQLPSPPRLMAALNLACAAKWAGTRCAEEIVTDVRRIVGGRCFTSGHPMERISQEVMFAPLGGEINALIERRYGRQLLGERDVRSLPW